MNTGSNFVDGYVSVRPTIVFLMICSVCMILFGLYLTIKNSKKKNNLFIKGIFLVTIFSSVLYFFTIDVPEQFKYTTITVVRNDTEIKILKDWDVKSRNYIISEHKVILENNNLLIQNIKSNNIDIYKLKNNKEAKKVFQYLKYKE